MTKQIKSVKEGLKKKLLENSKKGGGGVSKGQFSIKKKKHVLKTLEIA